MKKSTLMLLGAALLATPALQAQDDVVLANPTLEDGSFIVKYDMANHCFAADNDFEIDETFVFAIDVTGTEYETALKNPSRNPNVLGRGMAHDFYVNNDVTGFEHYSNGGNLDGRLFHIEGNIYGAVFNLFQLAQGRYKDTCFGLYTEDGADRYDAMQPGATVTFGANHFGFGWSADNIGEEWWDAIAAPITNLWFRTAPYTGTKTGADFYFDDFECVPFEGNDAEIADKGYAMPQFWDQLIGTNGVSIIGGDDADAPVEYYNIQGIRVENPAQGLYIVRQGAKARKVVLK
ncbi:MAG: hypothetical protein K2O78_05470 [Muribaculaceae bacterium]|nr:hypothetical protein [Muribaculaceae bacterium]